MTVRRFSRDGLPAMPWKNGGGTTREIASWPPGAALDDFGWRVSIATIAASGPFSVFAGIDRQIMLLDGDGVRLQGADRECRDDSDHPDSRAVDHRLDVPHRPFAFSGDAPIDCTLLGGASSDFNVMTRRGAWHADVRVVDGDTTLDAAPHGLLMVLRGAWTLRSDDAAEAQALRTACDGLCWTNAPKRWTLRAMSDTARLVAVRFFPSGTP